MNVLLGICSMFQSLKVDHIETHSDMLIGLMVGFFMGILAIYWIKEARMYNRQQQLGIQSKASLN